MYHVTESDVNGCLPLNDRVIVEIPSQVHQGPRDELEVGRHAVADVLGRLLPLLGPGVLLRRARRLGAVLLAHEGNCRGSKLYKLIQEGSRLGL